MNGRAIPLYPTQAMIIPLFSVSTQVSAPDLSLSSHLSFQIDWHNITVLGFKSPLFT